MRTRRDVWKLAADPTDQTLHWYSVAVKAMQSRTFDNPNSWKFQAAVHGYDASLYPPLRAGEQLPAQPVQGSFWDNCQHASWWFFPWHRIFLYLFESMCRDAIKAAGGPADWALPYWDYSHPSTDQRRKLPVPFRGPTDGGGPNPLFAQRAPNVNSGGVVGSTPQTENTSCMKSAAFSGKFPNGFGGGSAPVVQFSHYTGSCENGPHNMMHDAIGGQSGWMGNPDAAALDPIFWVHHSNIDRLWVIWAGAQSHTALSDAGWNNQTFKFFDSTGQQKSYKVSDVLQTTGPLCDYVYEDTTNPLQQKPPVRLAFSNTRFGKQDRPVASPTPIKDEHQVDTVMTVPQMIGASAPNIALGTESTSVGVDLHAPAATPHRTMESAAVVAPVTQRVYLGLENVTAKAHPIHTYAVYINVPAGKQPGPELLAGLIPRFGLVKASKEGQGLNLSFDISEIVATLESAGKWDPAKLQVTFAPHDEAETSGAEGAAAVRMQPVNVGRVSIYTE